VLDIDGSVRDSWRVGLHSAYLQFISTPPLTGTAAVDRHRYLYWTFN